MNQFPTQPLTTTWLTSLRRLTLALALALVVLVWPWYQLRDTLFGTESVENTWPTEGYSMSCAKYIIALEKLRVHAARLQIEYLDQAQLSEAQESLQQWMSILTVQMDTINGLVDRGTLSTRSPQSKASITQLASLTKRVNSALGDGSVSARRYTEFEVNAELAGELANSIVNELYAIDSQYYDEAIQSRNVTLKGIYDAGSAILVVALAALLLTAHALRIRRRALALQANSMAEVQRTAHARSVLLGMVSHELRTPLQTLDATLDLIDIRDPDAVHQGSLERARSSVALMSAELQTLAQYARLTTDDAQQSFEPIPVLDFISRIVRPYEERAALSGQRFVLPEVPDHLSVTADRTRLHQILDNYISNAVKYAGPGDIQIVFKQGQATAGAVNLPITLEVVDQGPGIPPTDLPRVWDPYYRVDHTARDIHGTGLGLAVVRLLAETVHWEVGYRRTSADTTCFYVSFNAMG